jgi:hypothetical protein
VNDPHLSQHPADQLIRGLIRSRAAATPGEVSQIVERMLRADFGTEAIPVPSDLRGRAYMGRTIGERELPLVQHLVKRVQEGQWREGTTVSEYLVDLRRAIGWPSARLALYERRGGHVAVTVSLTHEVVPMSRLGHVPQANLLVVYSADRSIIVSGYQFSELSKTGIPGDVIWLK